MYRSRFTPLIAVLLSYPAVITVRGTRSSRHIRSWHHRDRVAPGMGMVPSIGATSAAPVTFTLGTAPGTQDVSIPIGN